MRFCLALETRLAEREISKPPLIKKFYLPLMAALILRMIELRIMCYFTHELGEQKKSEAIQDVRILSKSAIDQPGQQLLLGFPPPDVQCVHHD